MDYIKGVVIVFQNSFFTKIIVFTSLMTFALITNSEISLDISNASTANDYNFTWKVTGKTGHYVTISDLSSGEEIAGGNFIDSSTVSLNPGEYEFALNYCEVIFSSNSSNTLCNQGPTKQFVATNTNTNTNTNSVSSNNDNSVFDTAQEIDGVWEPVSISTSIRGTGLKIPEEIIIRYCGDSDGCSLRMGMKNWDSSHRTASRSYLLFYNEGNGAWRVDNDNSGKAGADGTQHAIKAWACYLTDGKYSNWKNLGDDTLRDMYLLSWNQYNASCVLTIID